MRKKIKVFNEKVEDYGPIDDSIVVPFQWKQLFEIEENYEEACESFYQHVEQVAVALRFGPVRKAVSNSSAFARANIRIAFVRSKDILKYGT